MRGAEDKFPVLIYCILKANVPLCSHYHMLDDLISDRVAEPEARYRIEELRSALRYIAQLDVNVEDEFGVLTPLNTIVQRCKWTLKQCAPSLISA